MVSINSNIFEFGKICCTSKLFKSLNIANDLDKSIIVRIRPDCDDLRFTYIV
jgi:hypothetical protein